MKFWSVPEGGRELSRRAGSRRHAATASYPEPALRVRPPGLLARPRLRRRPGSFRPSPPDRGENGTSTIERYPRKFVPTSPPPLRGLRSGRFPRGNPESGESPGGRKRRPVRAGSPGAIRKGYKLGRGSLPRRSSARDPDGRGGLPATTVTRF